jgi:hypothetical protein
LLEIGDLEERLGRVRLLAHHGRSFEDDAGNRRAELEARGILTRRIRGCSQRSKSRGGGSKLRLRGRQASLRFLDFAPGDALGSKRSFAIERLPRRRPPLSSTARLSQIDAAGSMTAPRLTRSFCETCSATTCALMVSATST